MKLTRCLPRQDLRILKAVLQFARAKKARPYIVGGYLRDILLKRKKSNPDIDFCIKNKALRFAAELAKKLKAGYVVLDRLHGACRIVKKERGRVVTLDFTDFRGKTLELDLLHRDFTINTLAMELEGISEPRPCMCIDLYSAGHDLRRKIIRAVHEGAFEEDPLRILRAFSFSTTLGFRIDKKTLGLIRLKRKALACVAGERIRDELFKVLSSPGTFQGLVQMDRHNIISVIMPEIERMRGLKQGPYHHLDVWRHSLETVRQLEAILDELKSNRAIRQYLEEVISSDRNRRSLIKLGALLHDVGKPSALRRREGKIIFHGHEKIGWEITESIGKRMKFSNDELMILKKMVFWHLRPGYLADNEIISARARFRYFRDTGREALSVLLISLADQRATKGPKTRKQDRMRHERAVSALIREYLAREKQKKPERLISGDDVISVFKIPPSPVIGKVLGEIEELQAIGKVNTKGQALKAARKVINTLSRRSSYVED